MAKPIPQEWLAMMDAQDKRAGLPAGTTYGIVKTETGFQDRFIDDPSAAHYQGPNPKSSAAGLGGILKATAAKPGYGVTPLKDWSVPEQLRFIADYASARIKQSGSVEAGLAGYGEGKSYAQKVMGSRGNPVQLAQAPQVVPEVQNVAPMQLGRDSQHAPVPIAQAPLDVEWRQLQQAMPAKPVQVADLKYGDQMPMAQPYQFARAQPVQVMQPNFSRFTSWIGKA